jgi:methionine sulfoxide reductase heme-binding subunit
MNTTVVRWSVRAAIYAWVAYWIAQIFVGDNLGASPALELNHKLGLITLTLLSANLLLGILLDLLRPPPKWLRIWVAERRFWGVSAFLVLCGHVFFYFVNEGFEPQAWTQLYTKFYLIFASSAFIGMFILAATSNNLSIRKLGGTRWRKLHRIVYLVQFLLFGHILTIEKADLVFYGTWLWALFFLQIVRLVARFLRKRRSVRV